MGTKQQTYMKVPMITGILQIKIYGVPCLSQCCRGFIMVVTGNTEMEGQMKMGSLMAMKQTMEADLL